MAEYEKFTFDQGSDIAVELELVDINGNYKNLTNYSAAAQMKKNFELPSTSFLFDNSPIREKAIRSPYLQNRICSN